MKRKALNITWGIPILLLATAVTFYYFQLGEEIKREVAQSPPVDYWEMFAGISLERKYVEKVNAYYRIPVFTSELLALNGEEVSLSGYYLPFSKADSAIIISRYPYASCFFCGKAGVESVVMVELGYKNRKAYRTDQRLSVSGKLMLNSTDFKKLAFVIENASVMEVENQK